MHRTTLSLPDQLAALLRREAKRRDSSVSEVAREALSEHFGLTGSGSREIPFAGVGAGRGRHTARDMEALLDREWGSSRRR
ncbi:MAG: ribbon-helix-helix domain-containing protein [Solirubrobacterales bacterium]